MKSLRVHDFLVRRALVTRESAHDLERHVLEMLDPSDESLALDFANIDAMTPSFLDEALFVIAEAVSRKASHVSELMFLNPPTSPTAAVRAIARAHGILLEESPTGDWIMTGALAESSAL